MSLEKVMNSMSWTFTTRADRIRTRQEILTDYRTRLAVEEEARAQKRRHDLAEQCSGANAPETRIRTWERLHGLRMPLDPTHPILDIIAINTRLRSCDVHAVQAARGRRAPEAASTVPIAPETEHVSVTEPERR
jgi:hypothetical protein